MNLSPRQREVGSLLCYGMTDKMIARKLGIAEGTVGVHVAALMRKLGVNKRIQAALILARQA